MVLQTLCESENSFTILEKNNNMSPCGTLTLLLESIFSDIEKNFDIALPSQEK